MNDEGLVAPVSTLGRAESVCGLALRVVQVCLLGVAIGALVPGMLPPRCYEQDLQVDYLAAKALGDGVDPLTPTTELSAKYFPSLTLNFPHPNPHPPVLALVALPLTWLPFPVVALLWLAGNVGLVLAVGRWLGLSPIARLAVMAWPPLWCVLHLGQYEVLILLLAMLGWRAAKARLDARAGIWLGLAAVIKLYPLLFVVPYAMRRRWRVVLASGFVFSVGQLGSITAVGWSGFLRYYFEIVPAVSGQYARLGLNASVYGGLLRLFGGAADVTPVLTAPWIVVPLTVVVVALALIALARLTPERAPVAVLVALPFVWYYSVTLVMPELVALSRSRRHGRVAIAVCAASSCVLPLVNVAGQLAGRYLPPMAVLLAMQPIGLVGLLIMTNRFCRHSRSRG